MPEEHDRFANELDRMVTGQPPAEDSALAAFAREMQGIGMERIGDEQRDRIRRGLMQHANPATYTTPTTGGAGPLSQPTLTDPTMTNPWVRRRPAANTPSGWRGHMVKAQTAIAIVTAVALLIVGAAWYANRQGEDGPGPTTTRYAAAPMEDVGMAESLSMQESAGTPQATAAASSPLMEMLAVLPAPLALAEGGTLPGWTYADLDQRFEDLGLTDEQLAEIPMLPLASNAYAPLASTTSLFDLADDDAFVEAIGFNPLTVDQVLVTGRAPDVLTLLRGDWDVDALTAAWEAAGYTQHTTIDGVTIWSLDPEGMVDPQHPIQARMFQQLNNVAILDGGILAYAGYSGTIEMVIQTQTGEMASALDDPFLEPLFAAVPDGTVTSIGFTQSGSTLYDLGEIAANPNISEDDRATIEEQLRTSRETVGPMPEYRGVVFAVEGDPATDGEVVVRLRAFNDEDAEQIVRVFEWRWETFSSARYQRTFDSIMPLIDASADGDLVTLRFNPQGAPAMWLEILQGGDLLVFAVDVGLPIGTPEASPVAARAIPEEDAEWWTWPASETCDVDTYARADTGETGYPQREYLPLGTPDREDAAAAARVMRAAQSCGLPYVVEIFLTERAYEERILEEDEAAFHTRQAAEIEYGRELSEAFPIQDPREFGRLVDEMPVPATPSAMERWTGGPPAVNRYEPFTAVAIPSHAVLLPDGRIGIPESLIAWEGTEDLSYRGNPATFEVHITSLVVLSNESGQWLVDQQLPFCVGDCDYFWDEQEAMAERMRALATELASPEATPAATPAALAPVDDSIWLACPDYTGPYTYASREGVTSDVAPPGAFDPRSSWGPAEPPSIPCEYPSPEPPEIGIPIPLD